jgi:nitrogen fixation/metabolism regulation signal transduction histidine kinase
MATQTSHFRKTIPAFLAALGMTGVIALCILAFGVSALLNRKTAPVQAVATQAPVVFDQQATIQQLQEQIAQYQARETQFQSQLQQAADQINQLRLENQQYQAYQDIVTTLVNAGVIQIASDGSVIVNRSASTRLQGESESGGD